MDHYSEQLVAKRAETKELVLRGLIIFGGVAIAAFSVYLCFVYGGIMAFYPLIIGIGAIVLAVWLLGNTVAEYEYIVTNHDMDIDKIIGRRKRKRLVSISLNNVESWGEYTGKEGEGAAATVMASDATGVGVWYLFVSHDKLGKVLLLFTPDSRTLASINMAVPYSKRIVLPEEETDEENAGAEE